MRGKKGYTILELVIAVALLSMLVLLFYSIFGQGIRLYAEGSELSSEMTNLRQALSDITNTARLIDPASISYSSGILHIGSTLYSFSDQSVKKNGVAIAKNVASFVVSINNGILEITIADLSGKSISTSISLLG